MAQLKRLLIVGGGSAGWLTAAYLARVLGCGAPGSVQVSLLEARDIDPIGVGEGTFPSIRSTLATIGIDEAEFVRECSATFKQGIRFADWVRPPGSAGAAHYFHPFNSPSQRPHAPELLPYWLGGHAGGDLGFAAAASLQTRVADAGRGPKRIADPPYQGPLNYAYHFDAGRFAALLRKHACALGVQHLTGTVEHADLAQDGSITSVRTAGGEIHAADLFVDCTGFRAELIGKALHSGYRSVDDVLFADRALALQVPYASIDAPIASFTIATARDAGWIWDIGLQERRGVGYVYSSRHCDEAQAEQVLRRTVAEFPDRSRQWTRLALFCLHHDKPDEAAVCARRAISITPVSKSLPASFDVLAQVELKRGNLPEAEMWAHRAVTADGSSTAHRTLAEIYAAEGHAALSNAEASAAMANDASYRTK